MPTKTSGSTAITSTETDLFSTVISDNYHSCSINLDVMQTGDTYVFRCYGWDDTAGTAECMYEEVKSGAQTCTILTFNPVAQSHYRITAQKVSGVDRTFNWTRWI